MHAGRSCHVVGNTKFLAPIGGEAAVCATIERQIAVHAPGRAYRIEVSVPSASSLAARVRTGNGRELPEQNMTVSDARLTMASVERFATDIAASLVGAKSR